MESENTYQKNEEISGWKGQINIRKFNSYILTITDVFLNQKRVNICQQK